ncbi:unnamed protein product [Strongylus vulgaris]|uniref:Uncharacterized protein n=1 Tax=Strongylus vulgaris TaxID=40348 RepID=A0A3P7LA88_STRVU|nr:unnamed protein product [Strongylus vulgaris]
MTPWTLDQKDTSTATMEIVSCFTSKTLGQPPDADLYALQRCTTHQQLGDDKLIICVEKTSWRVEGVGFAVYSSFLVDSHEILQSLAILPLRPLHQEISTIMNCSSPISATDD